jgi:hypothetical protein
MVGADVTLALLVEEFKAELDDAFAGFYAWGHGRGL